MAETNEHEQQGFDAGRQRLGRVYAKALLGVTDAAGKSAAVLDEFDALVTNLLDKFPQFDARISAPRVPLEETLPLLDKVFGGRISGELLTFLKVVAKHGRLDCLRTIRREARHIYNEMTRLVEVVIRTANPVGADVLEQVGAKLKTSLGREVVIRHEIDADLIGGLLVQIGDKVFDGSVANRLARLRTKAVERATETIRESLARFVTTT